MLELYNHNLHIIIVNKIVWVAHFFLFIQIFSLTTVFL